MTDHQASQILINDLESMTHRIEALPAHPKLTEALGAVQDAERLVREAMTDLHHAEMRRQFGSAAE